MSPEYLQTCKKYHISFGAPANSYRGMLDKIETYTQLMHVKKKLPFQYGKNCNIKIHNPLNEDEKGIFAEIHSNQVIFSKIYGNTLQDKEILHMPLNNHSSDGTKEFEAIMKFLVYFANDKIEELFSTKKELENTLLLASPEENLT